ncbi:MAG: anaerobic sulfatase maturase [Phycisphaerae bacterium]
MHSLPVVPARGPFHVMTKPIGPVCNLACAYCFYLEKEALYAGTGKWRMPDDVLETYIRQYIQSQPQREVSFAWQGGEPTLMGVDFFRRVVELQRTYGQGRTITNALQTNGTLLDDEWATFLKQHEFLVGVSIDGPAHLHDRYRVGKRGEPTFDRVMNGIETLKRHDVAFNTLTVLNRVNSQRPGEVYAFLKQIGSGFLQFIPLVERKPAAEGPLKVLPLDLAEPPDATNAFGQDQYGAHVTDWSVRPDDFGRFYCEVFDAWVRQDVGRVFVQFFDVMLGQWMTRLGAGTGASLCVFAPTCGSAMAVEHNGDVYSCDHYVYPQYKLGNLSQTPLGELVNSPQQQAFGQAKSDSLPGYCRDCAFMFACHGECPKHRFLTSPAGEPGLNYLCRGYKRILAHMDADLQTMAQLVCAGLPAAHVMRIKAAEPGRGVKPARRPKGKAAARKPARRQRNA